MPLALTRMTWDHPRVCGEQTSSMLVRKVHLGSSPRVRGADYHVGADRHHAGIIPACAGSSSSTLLGTSCPRDHPRVCGEQAGHGQAGGVMDGSSPRVRGADYHVGADRHHAGIIPACAGSSASLLACPTPCGDHPRVCGEQTKKPQITIAHPVQTLTFQLVCGRAAVLPHSLTQPYVDACCQGSRCLPKCLSDSSPPGEASFLQDQ